MSAREDPLAAEVLRFWFGDGESRGKPRAEWFRKDPAFDAQIGERFAELVALAAHGGCDGWQDAARDCLALIVVLDQFPRNLFRGSARAFASDARARACAERALANGYDRELLPVERAFVYLPFEHSESLQDQDRCVRLMRTLDAYPETRDMRLSEWAEKHREVIRQFGRFPHRNAALGRTNTPEEQAYLATPGAGF